MPNLILDFLFPRKCVGCFRFGSYLCSDCQRKIKHLSNQICPECERNSIGGEIHFGCQRRYSLDGLTSAYEFASPIKEAIYQFKYKFVSDLKTTLVDLLLSAKKEDLKKDFVLVPIPLYFRKENFRGFNQVALLGKDLAEKQGLEFRGDLLKKVKDTKPQVKLKEKERKENIKGVFEVVGSVEGKNILLFDDVWTTGATIKEAGSVLKRKRAKLVWGLTLAR
ncbi:MAG: hypothetical protein A2Y57_00370 [Candidatus Woykebacteria bacterium RBG_13_40_7b]|uniref:Double zinc ribbon domain-containing protein n=1 Tax=Candidatus Woykebacteria bacterium RBG_13_40_7b TaxID=1802594 RepID=A0A1G1WAG1_9BACT|nr:MAG: hypothetical protein A2Y57_00370 [Candidatus Woykebacteria bacterium RBG_13_40_7b]